MAKYIYKGIILFFVFCGALVFFTVNQGNGIVNTGKTVNAGTERYPVLTVETGTSTINQLYGYSGTMAPSIVRLSITPIDASKSLSIHTQDGQMKIQKANYRILDKETNEVYEEKELNALQENQKKIPFRFEYAFDTGTEYIFALTVTLDTGERVNYYTRLKYYVSDTHLADKLKFALDFHNMTFSKDKDKELGAYLETDATQPNDTLSKVTIHSAVDLVTWGKISPKVTSDIIPVVKEFNTETACILLNYYVKGTTSSGTEVFHVKEFFRVRYVGARAYLLGYERTMEAIFDENLASMNKSQLKFGIMQKEDMDIVTSEDNKQLYFARNGILYRYDMNKNQNKLYEVYRTFSKNAADIYTLNNESDIRINKLDENGNLYFTVYGYIPRGEYEGKVAVILYEYESQTGQVKEVIYMPMDSTYQQLREDFNPYSYVNSNHVYYFIVDNIVYSYNIQAHHLDIIAEDIRDSSFVVMKDQNCFAWSSDLEKGYGESITVYNLENDVKTEIKAPNQNEYIRLLGTIDSNVVYGYVRKNEIKVKKDGTTIIPCYKMEIADNKGNVLKTYAKKQTFISDITVNGNVLTMERCKKNGKSYKKISTDSILNPISQEEKAVSLVSRVTSSSLMEWYLSLPYGYVLTKTPSRVACEDTIVTNERALHLEHAGVTKYYVYAMGRITDSYENPAEAIIAADEQMGVVVSGHHQVVWERGGSFTMNSIGGINLQKSGDGISSIGACAYMVLKSNHYSVDAKELTSSKKSVYEMLDKYMDRPVNLYGITLEEALYFVSSGKAVIAMTGGSQAVVISGYTVQNVTLLNPNTGKEETISRKQAEDIFAAAGNHFISYMS